MSNNFTLYYPTIEFRNPYWLWNAALAWDKVYRIVPENYEPADSENIRLLVEEGDFIRNINPKEYAEESSNRFIHNLKHNDHWWAAALDGAKYKSKEYVALHKDKADVKLSQLINESNPQIGDWCYVPQDVASIYMLYLARYIAEKNNLSLSTEYAEAWCGSSFFQYDGEIEEWPDDPEAITNLVAITVSSVIPQNICNVAPRDLIKFRNKFAEERKYFFQSMKELSTEISACSDEKVIEDVISEQLKKYERAKKEYKKCLRDININALIGTRTLFIPMVLTVASTITELSKPVNNLLQLSGVGLGVMGSLYNRRTGISKSSKNYEYNYLTQLEYRVPHNYDGYYMDRNIHQGYQLYLGDNLNHFLRD